ncbi:putative spermidine/putrescine transport system ATP-binding protein [Deinococcus metalli]|uniref:Polyamine-transporting ATPase n=1 Tax=Deinococcus metalli TaxID=1141878 RepID=A0A7W8NPI9_9DEIO|nr:ABC transporter ATP-binding protein [Deinococcus metalli]MBB5376821.1 putative spermidine/putrescine transport system ATP-binding protein [Deinococcus metalli]GHF45604.1 polyamine-transporting ATPase [Deinococcus metalli]
MSELHLSNITKSYGSSVALHPLDLTLERGELVTLLGPSGCGKTTLLRIVAGFLAPDTGKIVLGGRDLTRVPARQRDMGMVFQAYSLFPNLTAGENVAFGLDVRRLGGDEKKQRVDELFELIGLPGMQGRYPAQLSGGQQQRIALARALAIRPQVLLLDEPLSALDAQVRLNLRDEIRRVQQETGITTLFVTHDQEEALAISDRVVVMQGGLIAQVGTPAEIYRQPATPFVAEFIGSSSGLSGQVSDPARGAVHVPGLNEPLSVGRPLTGFVAGDPVRIYLRPEELRLSGAEARLPGDLDVLVRQMRFMGAVTRVSVGAGEHELDIDLQGAQAERLHLGAAAALSIPPQAVHVVRDVR